MFGAQSNLSKLGEAQALKAKLNTRIWLDIGTGEGPQMMGDVRQIRDSLARKGWVLKSDLMYLVAEGGTHNEESFAKPSEPMLKFPFTRPEGVK